MKSTTELDIVKDVPFTEKYSHFFVLVLNVSSENRLNRNELEMLHYFSDKWKKKHHDPNGERLHIIYLGPKDEPNMEKFDSLSLVDHRSKICVIGHCAPGAEFIRSDPIYKLNKDGPSDIKNRFLFTAQDLAYFLSCLLNKSDVVISLNPPEKKFYLHAFNQRLKICIPSCFSGLDKENPDGTLSPSFASRVFKAITRFPFIHADVVGYKGRVFPISTESNFIESLKFVAREAELFIRHKLGFSNNEFIKPKPGFHIRNLMVTHKEISLFQHQANNYKVTYTLSPNTTIEDFIQGQVEPVCLTTKEGNALQALRQAAERALDLCQKIVVDKDNHGEEIIEKAEQTIQGIQQGVFDKNEVNKRYFELMTQLDEYDESAEKLRSYGH